MSGAPPTPEEIDVTEFQNLRQEINNRTNLAYALITLQLAALGTGLSVMTRLPDVLLGLAAASSFLWLFWVDHAGQVYKIAGYIALELSPQLSADVRRPVLRWEHFLRRIDAGGGTTQRALYGTAAPHSRVYVQSSTAADVYAMLLFGCTPPLMICGYVVVMLVGGERSVVLVVVPAAAATGLWIYTVTRFRGFRKTVSTIGTAIRASDPDSGTGTGTGGTP
ncbi:MULTISPECIES: hypothetical protein [unclassified Streptomyces]|uniref:hypothetical protein n=1 Tax=unclassified Streptomyces TaxID=2593676 RepID=UPI001BE9D8C5|nr:MULTISPECIES: hypothetical protein [unclassified Streptomyces]MBT2408469.1 hypothetical protein [Streptomyces sp. ISL-21]MBT2611887.1 hypothetical protein [Streptomyces sp. ISL-87]